MPQGEHIELHRKRHGFRMDFHEKKRKREAREVGTVPATAIELCRLLPHAFCSYPLLSPPPSPNTHTHVHY